MKRRYLWVLTSIVLTAVVSAAAVSAGHAQSAISVLSGHLLGQGGGDLSCDANGDGRLDGIDLTLLRQEKAAETTATETTMPIETTTETTTEPSGVLRTVLVSNTEELLAALGQAQAGDEIVLQPGEYTRSGSGSNPKGSLFYSGAEGTAEQPILLRSADPANPAVLSGTDTASNYGLYITGDWWQIQDLKITTAQKGIMLDHSSYSRITRCEVYNIGSEGIHLRDDSCECIVEDCYVHDTGVVSPAYGEAVYVGSSQWTTGFGYSCDNNTIIGCRLGPDVAAEHVDIKEFTTGTVVAECIFDGTGMSGENYADSFVDVQGNDCVIRDNIGYRNGNGNITAAFQMHMLADGWGFDALFSGNQVYMDEVSCYFLDGWDCTAVLRDNAIAYGGEPLPVTKEQCAGDGFVFDSVAMPAAS